MTPSISVVIPTYARPHLLRRALDSVDRAATSSGRSAAVEVVVVDDEASETTKAVAQSGALAVRVRYLRHPRGARLGPSAARNHGVASSAGELLFWLDDDDEFLPNRFDHCLRPFEAGETDAVFETAVRERFRADGSLEEYLTGPGRRGANPDPFRFLLTEPEAGHIATGATSFTRRAFDRAGGLDERLDYGEDGEFLVRMALCSRVALLDGPPVVRIHQHGANISRPSLRRYWGPLKAMRAAYRNSSWQGRDEQRRFLADLISRKLDFALTRCRLEYPRVRRYREGCAALSCVPWSCLRARNLRSIAVWLLGPGAPPG